jgi:hypothetical protein
MPGAIRACMRSSKDEEPTMTTASKRQPIAAFIARKAEINDMLARLAELSDDHFNCTPDDVNSGDVGTLEHYAELLKRITDAAFNEGEHGE